MNKRLEQFLAAENISQSQLADIINVARASVSHIIAGRNKPSYDFITGMMEKFPKLNIEWLLSGKGKMYKDFNVEVKTPPVESNLFLDTNSQLSVEPVLPVESTDENQISQAQGVEEIKQSTQSVERQRVITKIVVFYDDNTFDEFSPLS